MGYKSGKTIHRDEISGLHVHDDGGLKNSTVSVDQLQARSDARQQAINDAIKADWPKDQLSTSADIEHPTYGNVGSRSPRPSDVSSKGDDRFGVSEAPGKQVPKKAPRSDSKASK
jgi:hypothetical protein